MTRALFPLLLPILFLAVIPQSLALGEERVEWVDSKIRGTPEPIPAYLAEPIWPHISFTSALAITVLESRGRMFVTEQRGNIWILPSDLTASPESPELSADLSAYIQGFRNAYGIAFHPRFESNQLCYIFYTTILQSGVQQSTVSSFRLDDSLKILPESREDIISCGAGGHNGGDIQFGPNGMLYIPAGDLAPPDPPDPRNDGQNLATIAGAISRIDVDRRDPGLPYGIPKDNPFEDIQGARPGIWAFGFRNPWKMDFHPKTSNIWLGDVGLELYEMVHRVEKGGNHGWSVVEGPVPAKPDQTRGPGPIVAPIVSYSHDTEGASVTGGFFNSGERFPELKDAYMYGDWSNGKVWALEWDGEKMIRNDLIAETRKQIVSFGDVSGGEIIFLDWPDDQRLHRLVPNPRAGEVSDFPSRLSLTGLFEDTENEIPTPGVYEFSINSPMWQEGAESSYWVAIPGEDGFKTSVARPQPFVLTQYREVKDSVLVKTIRLNEQRVETQILHWDGYWNGYTYRWNEEQTDAILVAREGLTTTVQDKPWRFYARNECMRCHGSNFHKPLAFFPGQMDRDDQIQRFLDLGLVDDTFEKAAEIQPIGNPYNESLALETRARSWIHSNCAGCHRRSGRAGIVSMMSITTNNENMRILNFEPSRGSFGLEGAPLIEPGNPYRSILYYRIATKGAGHMPMIGVPSIDSEGVQVVHDWIRSLQPDAPIAKAALDPKNVEGALALYHQIQTRALSESDRKKALANCLSHKDPFVLNLFLGM